MVNAYLLSLSALILIGGSLADVFGERRVFAIGVGGFGAVSLLCALAPTIEVLIAGRVLQGVFGALLTPSALAVIVSVFPPAERGAAIGSWTAWTGIAAVVGPLAGGQIVDVVSWRWIFALNVPFVAATLVLIAIAVPAGRVGGERRHVDVVGALLCALGLAGPTYALIRQPELGSTAIGVWMPLVGGLVLFAAFLLYEARASHPMLPLGLFRRRNFSVGNAETLLMYSGLSVLTFFLVLFLQQVAGYDALEAGLALLPLTVVMFSLSRYAGRLADRIGPRVFMGLGPIVSAAGMLLMLRLDADADYLTELLPAAVVFSVGLAMTVAPLTATVLADADEENAGIASGINNAIARVGGLHRRRRPRGGGGRAVRLGARRRVGRPAVEPAGRGDRVRGARAHARAGGPAAAPAGRAHSGARGDRAGFGERVPPRHGHLRCAAGERRRHRPGRDRQPAP